MRIAQRVWEFIVKNIFVKVKIDGEWIEPDDVAFSCPKFFYIEDSNFKEVFLGDGNN